MWRNACGWRPTSLKDARPPVAVAPVETPRVLVPGRLLRCARGPDKTDVMIWIFERGEEALRLETRYDSVSGEYVLVVVWGHRPTETERYRERAAFDARVRGLEQQLAAEHWTQVGSPTILRDGWRIT